MPTELLYHLDPALLDFAAVVLRHDRYGNRSSVVLDRTAFYPEAGGQLGDRGTLGNTDVADVQVDDAGEVHHLLADGASAPAPGTEVHGRVERSRRRVHQSLHTAQHMLSRALLDEAGAETASARLGESNCTIDVARPSLDERAVARAEALVNSVIDDDVAIRAFFPSESELRALPLRRAPKVSENVRVVQIGDFDVSPCGGTHCTRTAQVALVRVTGLERYKGMTRVSFTAGARGRDDLGESARVLRALGQEFSCQPAGVPEAVARLRQDLVDARAALSREQARRAEREADALLAAASSNVIVAAFPGESPDFLRAVGARLTRRADAVALLAAPGAEGCAVLVARGEQSGFDCGTFLKRAAAASGGRGGGRVDRAEGRLPASVDWPALVATSLPG